MNRKNEISGRVTEELSRHRPGFSKDDSGGDEDGESGGGERYQPALGQRDFFSRQRAIGRQEMTDTMADRIQSRLRGIHAGH